METLELFYPQIAARAGPYTLDAGIEFEIFSAKSSYFDWAKIRFTEQFQPEISLARKDPAAIELGYNGVTEEVFTGFVARPYNKGGGADEITLKDEMLLLEDTQINNTFLDTTPQEVISYVLAQAGVGKKKLNARGFPTRKKLPIRQMSGVQAINAVNAAWSLKERFFFSGGVFYWGEKPEQQKVYTFEYGVSALCRRQQDREGHQDCFENLFLGQCRSLHFLLMSLIEYIVEGEHHTMKTRTPATGVLMCIILFVLLSRDRVVS